MFVGEVSCLGSMDTVVTGFDANDVRKKFVRWLDTYANGLLNIVIRKIQMLGYHYPEVRGRVVKIDMANNLRPAARQAAIRKGLTNLNWAVRSLKDGRIPGDKSIVFGISKGGDASLFEHAHTHGLQDPVIVVRSMIERTGSKTIVYRIPWTSLYDSVIDLAKVFTNMDIVNKLTEMERKNRKMVSKDVLARNKIEEQSARASRFQLPENVTSISRGSLVIAPTKEGASRDALVIGTTRKGKGMLITRDEPVGTPVRPVRPRPTHSEKEELWRRFRQIAV